MKRSKRLYNLLKKLQGVQTIMWLTSALLVILAIAPFNSAHSLKNVSPHIIGGHEAKPHSHPHQVLLNIHYKDILTQDATCGGSLISSEWILTAAHCTDNVVFIFAVLGAHDKKKYEVSQQMKVVSQIRKHPQYNIKTAENDIALLKFEPAATFNDKIQPIRLPSLSQKSESFWRYSVIATGWGLDSYDDNKKSTTTLQAMESTVTTNWYCWYRYGFAVVQDFHMCIDGSDGKAPYRGDSGGPLVITESDGKFTLVGITSLGVRNGTEKSFPSIFTRITTYLDWISKVTGTPLRK